MKTKLLLLSAALAVSLSAADGILPSGWSAVQPVIDGDIADPAWEKAPLVTEFVSPDKKPVKRKTEARVLWTPAGLAVSFRAFVDPASLPKIKAPPHDKSAGCSDCVEIMVDPLGDGGNYYHFLINAAGGTYDAWREQGGYVTNEKWNGVMHSAYRIVKDGWTSEMFIPYSTLNIPAKAVKHWKLNLARESFNPLEITSTSNGSFHTGADFRNAEIPSQLSLEPWKVSLSIPEVRGKLEGSSFRINIKADLQDFSGLPERELLAEAVIRIPGTLSVQQAKRFRLAANGTEKLDFSGLILAKPGRYDGEIVITDHQTGRVLSRTAFPVQAEYLPIRITLQDPHYRNAIFATQKLDNVRFDAVPDIPASALKGTITGGIRSLDGKILAEKTVPVASKVHFEFPIAPLPETKMEIFVKFGKDVCTLPVRKLPYKAGEVWRGKDGNWYRDGKKIFINSAWNSEGFYPDYNVIVGESFPCLIYNAHTMSGTRVIRDDLMRGAITDKVRSFYKERVNRMIDNPRLFGHFLCDEPDCVGYNSESFAKVADYIRELDPYHPIMISPGSVGLIEFAGSAEISGFHCYPRVSRTEPMSNFEKIVSVMDKAAAHFRKQKNRPTVTYLHQGFDYSDYGNTDTRVPSFDEFRSQDILSLILGGTGFMHYNRSVQNYPEIYIGMPHLTKEQAVIGNEAVIEPDAPEKITDVSPGLRLLAKKNSRTGAYWILVCNTSRSSGKFSFRFAPFAGNTVRVLSENRTAVQKDGLVEDDFTPFQVHVYTTDTRDFRLKDLAAIRAAIENEYVKRREANKGNLAYQENENVTVFVTASSNALECCRPDATLWHIADGLAGDGKVRINPLSSGILYWKDKTPDKVPDWIAMQFRKPVTVSRVEVYPVEDSLKEYEIQVMKDGKFVTAASVKNASGAKQTVTFAPVTTDAVRLFATANRGRYTMVYEIKVFEK